MSEAEPERTYMQRAITGQPEEPHIKMAAAVQPRCAAGGTSHTHSVWANMYQLTRAARRSPPQSRRVSCVLRLYDTRVYTIRIEHSNRI